MAIRETLANNKLWLIKKQLLPQQNVFFQFNLCWTNTQNAHTQNYLSDFLSQTFIYVFSA